MVEKAGEEGLDVIASPELVNLLGVPEYHRLSFGGENEGASALSASYDSDYFRSLERLFVDAGRRSTIVLETPALRPERIAETLASHLPLVNAAFRLMGTEQRAVSYFLIYFRFTALSDDRQDGMFSVLVNPLNASTAFLKGGLEDLSGRIRPPAVEEEIAAAEMRKIIGWGHKAGVGMVREMLMDFIRSAERRLNRDVKRVYEYYETLKEEIDRRARRRAARGEGAEITAQTMTEDEQETLRGKRDAVEAEREWKIRDLVAKYALGIRLDPLCIIRIQVTAPVFLIHIKRRLASRPFSVTYNPVLKRIDPLPCESCFHPTGAYTVCDDKLHIVCGGCAAAASRSGRHYCPVCDGKQ